MMRGRQAGCDSGPADGRGSRPAYAMVVAMVASHARHPE